MACTFVPAPFCNEFDSSNTILYGKTIEVIDDGVRFQIFDVLTGNETEEVVTIYDQLPFECNGTFFLDAIVLLPMDLEVIVSIEKVDSLLNPWEVIGDYRVSEYYTQNRRLLVEDGNVTGNITEPFQNSQSISFDEFVSKIQGGTATCLILDVEDTYVDDVVALPNPVSDQLFLSYTDQSSIWIEQAQIYTQLGSRVELSVASDNSLDVSHFPNGFYLIEVQYSDGLRSRHKIVISN